MLMQIEGVLTPDELADVRRTLDAAAWGDGRATAGYQSGRVKHNLQLPENSPEARRLGQVVTTALGRNPLFHAVALPHRVYPPLFSRYEAGMAFGNHVDNAIRGHDPLRLRTDLSATLFLSDPGDYDGGELVIDDVAGSQQAKLAAGDMVLYPSTTVHRVETVTRGVRQVAFLWLQSLVRDPGRRALLVELDVAINRLNQRIPEAPELVLLTGCYQNLLRMWAEL